MSTISIYSQLMPQTSAARRSAASETNSTIFKAQRQLKIDTEVTNQRVSLSHASTAMLNGQNSILIEMRALEPSGLCQSQAQELTPFALLQLGAAAECGSGQMLETRTWGGRPTPLGG
jgi:hypothetical protein